MPYACMQSFLQLRLGCRGLPIAASAGQLAGAGHMHVDRVVRVGLACNSGAVGNEKHMSFECAALSLSKQQHADLSPLALTPCTPFRSAAPSHVHGLFGLYVISQSNKSRTIATR